MIVNRHLTGAIAIAVLGCVGVPEIEAQRNPPASQTSRRKPKRRSVRRAVGFLAAGAGLFFGGVALLHSADRYQKSAPTCIYFLGCFTSDIRVTNRGRQIGGASLMATGGTLLLLGVREWHKSPFVKGFDTPRTGPVALQPGMPSLRRLSRVALSSEEFWGRSSANNAAGDK